jgi:hypothetical protein
MKPRIVVEGRSDAAVLRSLFDMERPERDRAVIIIGKGKGRSAVVARSILIEDREPVAIVVDADSVDPREVWRVRDELEERVEQHPDDFRVLLFEPSIEVVFFHDRAWLEGFLGRAVSEADFERGRREPREVLRELLGVKDGPVVTEDFLARLRTTDVTPLRSHPVLVELRKFIDERTAASAA